MRGFINKYGGVFLGCSLFLWIGYNLFIEDLSPQKYKPVVIPLLLATLLVVQGFIPKEKIKQITKKLELKRILILTLLPPLVVVPMFVFSRFIASIINGDMVFSGMSGLTYHILEASFLALGGVAFIAVFSLYLLLPVLIVFSIMMLILEKKCKCHYRILISLSPLLGGLLVLLMIFLLDGGFSKVLEYGGFYWGIIVASPVSVAIEQFLYKRKLRAG